MVVVAFTYTIFVADPITINHISAISLLIAKSKLPLSESQF